jgi:hypothetical protein
MWHTKRKKSGEGEVLLAWDMCVGRSSVTEEGVVRLRKMVQSVKKSAGGVHENRNQCPNWPRDKVI